MTTRLRTVSDTRALLMGQGFLIHAAQKAGAAGVTTFAPTGTVTLTVVMVHRLAREAGLALVAGIAIHA